VKSSWWGLEAWTSSDIGDEGVLNAILYVISQWLCWQMPYDFQFGKQSTLFSPLAKAEVRNRSMPNSAEANPARGWAREQHQVQGD